MKPRQALATAISDVPKLIERFDSLSAYYHGRSKGDADMIGAAVTDNYVWDDPQEGRLSKADLAGFLPAFKETINRRRADGESVSYLSLSDWVFDRSQSVTTVWCSFSVPGTDIRGLSQIRVGDDGVISEHRAYRSEPQRRTGPRSLRSGRSAGCEPRPVRTNRLS